MNDPVAPSDSDDTVASPDSDDTVDLPDTEDHPMSSRFAWVMLGAIVLSLFSALQKYQLGVPVRNPGGYAIPLVIGGAVGLGVGYASRQRDRHLDRLRTEIENRREKERRLRRYRQAVESSTNMITAIDREYNILFANREYREFHDLPSDIECCSRTLPEILGPAAFADVEPYIEGAFDGEIGSFQVTRTGTDGTERVFHIRNYPIEEDGEITGVVAAMNDVTERRESERRLRTQKQRYQSLFESIRDAIVVADTDLQIVRTNPAFEALFGYSADAIEGRPTGVLYTEAEGFDPAGARGPTTAHGPRAATYEYRKQSGQSFTGEESLFRLYDTDDELVGFVALIRDVSERETRLQQLQVLDRVLRHNINNDMNVISGYAETIRDSGPPSVREPAETIIETSDDLVDIAAKEREITSYLSDAPDPERRDLAPIVRDAVDLVHERYPEATIDVAIPDHCAATATVAIGRAVEELILNAIEHATDGYPQVRVTVEAKAEVLDIAVADVGPGIPEMERSVLSGEADIEPLYHGSGLGLWLVHLIVQQSDGVLHFEDNEPMGTIVTISLPLDGASG
jgi:PAS domain S-box-containing protein